LLIDCEEDRVLRAVLVGMLREMERKVARPRQIDPVDRSDSIPRFGTAVEMESAPRGLNL
jgi:hypothetical protein